MAFKVIGDSCCDFTKLQMKKGNVVRVPMSVIKAALQELENQSSENYMQL